MNDRREDQFHRKAHLASIHHDAGGAGHEGVVNHVQQVVEIDSPIFPGTFTEVDDDLSLIHI